MSDEHIGRHQLLLEEANISCIWIRRLTPGDESRLSWRNTLRSASSVVSLSGSRYLRMVCADGQKMLLANKSVGGGSMRPRGQCSTTSSNVACGGPNSSSSMARPGLENAIAAVWSGVPVQRCTVGVVEEVSYSSLDAAISPSPSRDCRQANGEARGSPRDQMPPKGSIRISPPLDKRASGLPRSSPS